MPPSRIDKALLLLPPFDQLLGSTRDRISRLKHRYPCDDELITHLMHMDPRLVALVPYLVWIPYEQFFDVQKVGQGGFATVWKARFKANQGFDVILALKEIDVSFQQEMNVIGLSKDPESGRNLIVMAFAKGGSLEKRLDETELRGPWSDTFGAALRVSTALASLHLIGVTHNDLHPGNIVYTKRDDPSTLYFIDIGLGKVIPDKDDPNDDGDDDVCYGRLPYLPPECFKGKLYTAASDVYCLGTILWQLISHVPPRGTAGALFRDDGLREDPVPGTPTGYQTIINECWSIAPERRPTALQVCQSLEKLRGEFKPPWLSQGSVLQCAPACFYRLRAYPSRKTKKYVAQRIALHRQRLEENGVDVTDDSFMLNSGPESVLPSVSKQSQYYTRQQLTELSRSCPISCVLFE
ncbi:hypothetical protein BC936DRAFT_144862 [Jimgerdemannia flammicorona]|uniref:Protein kinase domain-containing protein n=1 Tax=Jimgerdemannia flammicorona TaxID=994334 RepID=A0A433DBH1_9FUNG|nr:hypothetical protein BC936DRAFT_144862 [Jimgerdemannia flammicorona]